MERKYGLFHTAWGCSAFAAALTVCAGLLWCLDGYGMPPWLSVGACLIAMGTSPVVDLLARRPDRRALAIAGWLAVVGGAVGTLAFLLTG